MALRTTFALLLFITLVLSIKSTPLPDWLTNDINIPTTLTKTSYGTIVLSNGIIAREFTVSPDFATIDLYSFERQSSLLRAINPEAVIGVDGTRYRVGGLKTDIPRAYLNRTDLASNVTVDPGAFHFVRYETDRPNAPFPYTPARGAPQDITWPPKGLTLSVYFQAPTNALEYVKHLTVVVIYEMYDGIPLLAKWVKVISPFYRQAEVNIFSVEYLSVNQQWSSTGNVVGWFYVETDQPHGTEVIWRTEPTASTMPGSFEPTVNCTYQTTPSIPVSVSGGLETFRVHELLVGSSDRERIALARHRMYRLLAPHTQENPIFFHMVDSSSAAIRALVDQMAEVGFEMLIYSFGSGFNIETDNATFIEQVAADVAYAKSKGIEVGGYDLIAYTRRNRPEWMAQEPHKPIPQSTCFASGWVDYLSAKLASFMEKTGLMMLETDGPYDGYACSSTNHSHHRGLEDSVYMQNKLQGDFYRNLRAKRVYINQPDYYFYQGGSKTGLGYNERQYSLPRWQDLSVSRQGMYDDTYKLIPTAGWMFVPLVQYHGGGAPAVFEPLSDHLLEYEWALAQYLGAGVAACYRGYRLYDSDKTKAIVTKWVSFYKKYRDILTSDIVHVRRADMQWIDSFLHVNPRLRHKGLAMVFNPTAWRVTTTLTLPLYYTGLSTSALISEQEGTSLPHVLARDYSVDVAVDLQPRAITWFLIQ